MNPTCTLGALPEKMLDEIDAYVKKKAETDADIPLETFRKTLFWKGFSIRLATVPALLRHGCFIAIRAKPGTTPERIEAIKRELDRVYLKQVIKKFCVNESINLAQKKLKLGNIAAGIGLGDETQKALQPQ
uniref:Uncharacterized protein n=1 Tax=Parascaris equorum TaxID=6256 RepID=A0A914S3Q0_PAREQ